MGDPYRRIGGVHMLPPGPGRAICIDPNICRVDLYINIIIHHGIDPHRAKGCVPFGGRVKRRNTHQTVHPAFRFQPAISVLTANFIGHRFNASLFPGRFGLHFDFITSFLRPSQIHPRQHRGPIAAFSATRARMHFEKRIIAVGLTVQ